MDPFFVLDLPLDATDEQVEQRYRELAARFPPDRRPGVFDEVSRAYQALRDARSRVATRLFYFDERGSSLAEGVAFELRREERRRLGEAELAELLR